MAKKYQKRKLDYTNKVEYYKFKEHSMIKLPIKVNPVSGYGEATSMGVPKAKGILDNILALRKFVQAHEDELKTIGEEAHLKQQEGGQ